jgi:hypothetical protein
MMFKQIVFDEGGCYEGLKALKSYKREFDQEKKAFRDKPLHDWASNYADSFRYLSLVAKLGVPKPEIEAAKPFAVPLHYSFSLEDAWKTGHQAGERIR